MQSTQVALRLCGKCRTLKNAKAFFKLSDYNLSKAASFNYEAAFLRKLLKILAISDVICYT
jgi:hypothetical protein